MIKYCNRSQNRHPECFTTAFALTWGQVYDPLYNPLFHSLKCQATTHAANDKAPLKFAVCVCLRSVIAYISYSTYKGPGQQSLHMVHSLQATKHQFVILVIIFLYYSRKERGRESPVFVCERETLSHLNKVWCAVKGDDLRRLHAL